MGRSEITVIFFAFILVTVSTGYSQSNTFPSSGNVGIGTTSPNSPLTVKGTLNIGVRANYGGDFATDNADYSNVLSIGDIGPESGLKIYKQGSGDSPSFLGPNNYNDSYVFEMTDTNGNTPDGGIVFAGTGKDDIFDGIFYIRGNGRVGVGVKNPSTDFEVDGTAKAEEVIVEENVGADFVFEVGYALPELEEVESHIQKHKHLQGIPSAQQMRRHGVRVGDLQMKLLQKIEELTLYVIELKKENRALAKENKLILEMLGHLESSNN